MYCLSTSFWKRGRSWGGERHITNAAEIFDLNVLSSGSQRTWRGQVLFSKSSTQEACKSYSIILRERGRIFDKDRQHQRIPLFADQFSK
jgi:hypothetical protein